MRLAGLLRPSRPEEFHPESLTDPDLPPSRHSARATARRLPPSIEHQPPSDLSGGDLRLACARFTTTQVPGLPQPRRASSDHASARLLRSPSLVQVPVRSIRKCLPLQSNCRATAETGGAYFRRKPRPHVRHSGAPSAAPLCSKRPSLGSYAPVRRIWKIARIAQFLCDKPKQIGKTPRAKLPWPDAVTESGWKMAVCSPPGTL
jgi:hypothetical protein